MSKRTNTSTKPMNPSGFLFTIKHKATPSSNGMSMSKIDLSKPIIKIKAKSASSGNSISKKGGRKTLRKTRRKIRRKTHRKKKSKTRRKK
jgi:hypothetical protein